MNMPISALLFHIQALLFTGSSLLLAGSLIGLYVKGRLVSEGPAAFFTGSSDKSTAEEPPDHDRRRSRRLASATLLELMDPSGEFLANSARIRIYRSRAPVLTAPF